MNTDTGSPFTRRASFPLILVILLFAACDVFVPLMVQFTGWLGDMFGRTDLRSSSVLRTLFIFMHESCYVQPAVVAVWLAFGRGPWKVRLPVALALSVLLAALRLVAGSSQLVNGHWWINARWWMTGTGMADLLAFATPLVAWRVWRGHVLVNARHDESRQPSVANSRFTIRDVLFVTATVAFVAAAVRWSADLTDHPHWLLPALGVTTLNNIIWSVVTLVPLTWCALGIRSTPKALLSVAVLTAVFSAFDFVFLSRRLVWPLLGIVAGKRLTVPFALLLWRWLGYRLVSPAPLVSASMTDEHYPGTALKE